MPGRPLGLLLAVSLAACGAGGAAPRAAGRAEAQAAAPAPAPVRVFQGAAEDAFWITHAPELDRVVSGGARLSMATSGEITEAAWDLALAQRGDPIVGALAVPERLGGGFVHWTRARVFRSRAFTGPLEPVAAGVEGLTVHGARSGLSSVVVFTDAGPRELRPGEARLRPLGEPGILDVAALGASRAARLDVFGRALATDDGGRSYRDLTPSVGLGVQRLSVGEAELFADTLQARFVLPAGGQAEPTDPATDRPVFDPGHAYQILWKGTRTADRDDPPFGLRDGGPLSAVVATGAAVGDGTGLAVVQGAVARVDLASGRLLSLADWLPSGLLCQPLRAADAVLFACVWERYQSYGGYVLRSVGGAPPVVEKAFSDDGSFVADDEGALGFIGSCRVEPHYFDAEEQARMSDGNGADAPLRPVFCVRRGPGDWVERQVELGDDATLVAWIPRRDGTAAALALSTDPLPPALSPGGRVSERAGVRLIRLYHELAGWQLARPSWQSERGGLSGYVDRRFSTHEDGSVDAWLAPSQDGPSAVAAGVTFDPGGYPVLHEVGPAMVATATGGSFGVALSREGDLYETVDHGRTFRPAGKSPVSPGAVGVGSCSALGCAMGPVTRLGWGDGHLAPIVHTEALAEAAPPPPAPRLVCTPIGAPVPVAAPPPLPAGAHEALSTGWGDTLDIVQDASAAEPAPAGGAPAASTVSVKAAPKKARRASPAVLKTHTLVLRAPFDPRAAPRRLNATDASFKPQRRSLVTPLLGARGEVDLLVSGEETELLVVGDRVTSLTGFEARRSSRGDGAASAGLATAAGHALVLGDLRRRLALEDHGEGAPPPPLLVGPERDPTRKRPMSLARRDDGALGVLVLDGPAPETAGAAVLDQAAASAGPVTRLAGWGTVTAGDDPRCKAAEKGAWRALVVIDPAAWLALDATALPGMALAHEGMLLVRWGRERVCLEGLEAALVDQGRRGEGARGWSLVVRWGAGAAMRARDVTQEVVCRVGAAAGDAAGRDR